MSALEQRVVTAARSALADTKSVVPLDVLCRIGWLTQNHLDYWRQGRADYLEPLETIRPENLALALHTLHRWAEENELVAREASYIAATRDRRALRFTASGDEAVERVFRTHWISPALPEKTRERLVERSSKPPELLVIAPLKDWTCTGCDGTGDLLMMEDAGPLCLTCVDLDHLVFLPSGDATLTRRAKKASALTAVVVQWSRSRKRYERQGTLVEEAAVEHAEASCLADEDARARQRERARQRREIQDVELAGRMAAEIVRLLPGCPPERAEAIAAHTAVRGSGRVGRSAAGRALDPDALMRAVAASVRHEDTGYDELLMAGIARTEARDRVWSTMDAVLDRWRAGSAPAPEE